MTGRQQVAGIYCLIGQRSRMPGPRASRPAPPEGPKPVNFNKLASYLRSRSESNPLPSGRHQGMPTGFPEETTMSLRLCALALLAATTLAGAPAQAGGISTNLNVRVTGFDAAIDR